MLQKYANISNLFIDKNQMLNLCSTENYKYAGGIIFV